MGKTAKAARKEKRKAAGMTAAQPKEVIPAATVKQAVQNLAILSTRAATRDMAESDARAHSLRVVSQHFGIPLQQLIGQGAPPPAQAPEAPADKDATKAA